MTAQLIGITCEPIGEGIADTLDDIRRLHDEGKISSVAVAVVYRDGTTSTANSFAPSMGTLIGAVTMLLHRLARGHAE
jgi:hypothetical protein